MHCCFFFRFNPCKIAVSKLEEKNKIVRHIDDKSRKPEYGDLLKGTKQKISLLSTRKRKLKDVWNVTKNEIKSDCEINVSSALMSDSNECTKKEKFRKLYIQKNKTTASNSIFSEEGSCNLNIGDNGNMKEHKNHIDVMIEDCNKTYQSSEAYSNNDCDSSERAKQVNVSKSEMNDFGPNPPQQNYGTDEKEKLIVGAQVGNKKRRKRRSKKRSRPKKSIKTSQSFNQKFGNNDTNLSITDVRNVCDNDYECNTNATCNENTTITTGNSVDHEVNDCKIKDANAFESKTIQNNFGELDGGVCNGVQVFSRNKKFHKRRSCFPLSEAIALSEKSTHKSFVFDSVNNFLFYFALNFAFMSQ